MTDRSLELRAVKVQCIHRKVNLSEQGLAWVSCGGRYDAGRAE